MRALAFALSFTLITVAAVAFGYVFTTITLAEIGGFLAVHGIQLLLAAFAVAALATIVASLPIGARR